MTRVDFDCKGSRAKQELDCVGRKNPNSNIEPNGTRKWNMKKEKSHGKQDTKHLSLGNA